MRFGTVRLEEAENAILAHSLRLKGLSLKKGRRLSASDPRDPSLRRPERGGGGAARSRRSARGHGGNPPGRGAPRRRHRGADGIYRPGQYPRQATRGLLTVDRDGVDALNAVHETVTLATLAENSPVEPGQMLAHGQDHRLCCAAGGAGALHRDRASRHR